MSCRILEKLPRSFYARDAISVAKDLLGKFIVHRFHGVGYCGKIVETEAYLGPHDRASHSARGMTARNAAMFGPTGHAYVYLIYGVHCCFNIVTGKQGDGAAVLIRAIEPIAGTYGKTNGPGLLARAMNITRALNGHDLFGDTFYIAQSPRKEKIVIVRRRRIGVDYAGAWARRLLRFYVKD